MRLDHLITEKFSLTGNKAQQLIKNGLIFIAGKQILKPSFDVTWEEDIHMQDDKSITWVSRSAGKLDWFLEQLSIHNYQFTIIKTRCLDIGSSTGGFTQVLLERWASHVDAVDVGRDQLHANIRNDERVRVFEQTDIRDFGREQEGKMGWPQRNIINPLGGIVSKNTNISNYKNSPYDIITIDVSFISLREIIPELDRFADEHTEVLLLYKPQFEVGRANLRKTWVPKNEKLIMDALCDFEDFLDHRGWRILYREKASVIGEAGNQEWMMLVQIQTI